MKKMILIALAFAGTFAFADAIKPVAVNVTCIENVDPNKQLPRAVTLETYSQFTIATVAGYAIFSNQQVTAATEGGDPYIQYVQNGVVNIFMAGEQLTQLFNQDGQGFAQLDATVTQVTSQGEQSFQAVCLGYVGIIKPQQ